MIPTIVCAILISFLCMASFFAGTDFEFVDGKLRLKGECE